MSTSVKHQLVKEYQERVASYDEILDEHGHIKPMWMRLLQHVEDLGIDTLQGRHEEMVRQLRENGVTYNVYDGHHDNSRPWLIDPIPLLIDEADWQQMERGIQQRSQLLNILLQDLYGARHLLRDKVIPPGLLFRHSGFLRACTDLTLPKQRRLIIHGLDMARGPQGKMWVLNDRAEAPSGMGYALENRKVTSQITPELYQGIRTQSMAPFFATMQQSMVDLLPRPKENPFIVYLTPGPMNETYFEHSYLSSYMGYTLVQGSDLVVRDGFVWLKCIDGLQKVDVIIRRIDDGYCDPLELHAHSMLGVAGLLEVMRKGNITVVNPPGSGVLENRGLFAFMNTICRYYLNEELLLPNMATWWCGQEKELKYVLEHLDQLIIKKVDRNTKFKRIYGRLLSKEALADLKAQILQTPYDFIGHEEASFSTVPAFIDGALVPRMAAVRCYSVATTNGYQVMPGGLTRTSPKEGIFSVSNRYGGIAKDTWVISSVTEESVPLGKSLTATISQQVSLSSRSAENLFWVGRMTERSIATTSFLNLVLNAWADYQRSNLPIEQSPLKQLLMALTNLTITYPGFVGKGADQLLKRPIKEILDLATNPSRSGSIPYDLQALASAALSIREHISLESWKVLDVLQESQQHLQEAQGKKNPVLQVQQHLQAVNRGLFTFYGTLSETMPRHEGRLLFKAGKLIERSLASIAVIRTLLGFQQNTNIERSLMERALVYHHALTHYRMRYRTDVNIITVLDTLIYAGHLPYSLIAQLDKIDSYLTALPAKKEKGRLHAGQKLLLATTTMFHLTDATKLSMTDDDTGYRAHFDQTLSAATTNLLDLSSALTDRYFNHTQTQYL